MEVHKILICYKYYEVASTQHMCDWLYNFLNIQLPLFKFELFIQFYAHTNYCLLKTENNNIHFLLFYKFLKSFEWKQKKISFGSDESSDLWKNKRF